MTQSFLVKCIIWGLKILQAGNDDTMGGQSEGEFLQNNKIWGLTRGIHYANFYLKISYAISK